ncbi:MAG: TraB/GumN family protein [Sphingomicrobium sp.]
MLTRLLRKGRRTLAAMLAVLAPVPAVAQAPAQHAEAAQPAKPALWVVSDPDTIVYLFGTIHLLPKDIAWRGGSLDGAVAKSDALIIETIIDDKNPLQFMQTLNAIAVSANLKPLVERVSPDKRPTLEKAIKGSGMPAAALDRMETWAAAFLLLGAQFREIGLKGEDGVETVLRKAFTEQGKPVGALESNSEQLSFFDRLPEAAQVALLEGSLSDSQDMRKEFANMLTAWVSGDVAKIAETFDKDLAQSPDLRDALMVRRNRNWADWIERRMASPGSVMVAVGAGHLAGTDSVQRYLQTKGFNVQRLQ